MRGDVASFHSQVEHGVKHREAVSPLGGREPVGGAGLHQVFLFLLILMFVVTRLPPQWAVLQMHSSFSLKFVFFSFIKTESL